MCKCTLCGSTIQKHFYDYQSNIYGSDCIKKLFPNLCFRPDVLNFYNKISGGCIIGDVIDVEMYINVKEGYEAEKEQRELEKERKQQELELKRNAETKALIETLQHKDLSKIKSESKLGLMNSFINQYSEKGYLSEKQRDIIEKWLTKKEKESYKQLYNEYLRA